MTRTLDGPLARPIRCDLRHRFDGLGLRLDTASSELAPDWRDQCAFFASAHLFVRAVLEKNQVFVDVASRREPGFWFDLAYLTAVLAPGSPRLLWEYSTIRAPTVRSQLELLLDHLEANFARIDDALGPTSYATTIANYRRFAGDSTSRILRGRTGSK